MPFGVTYLNPQLTDDQAYDVAGYISRQARPVKKDLEKDFPNLAKKPVSTPYPPYADPFSTEQHQVGPFLEIMDFYLKNYQIKKTK
jgi:thiosulfate dehydrogenase